MQRLTKRQLVQLTSIVAGCIVIGGIAAYLYYLHTAGAYSFKKRQPSPSPSATITPSPTPVATPSPSPTPQAGVSYYVAPTGSDTNAGTSAAPFATITHARDVIRALSATAKQSGVVVYVHGGEYDLTAPITFDATDSGTATAPISYVAVTGETPVIKGSVAITTTAGDTGTVTYHLGTDPKLTATTKNFLGARGLVELFMNGARQRLAQTPDYIAPDFTLSDPYAGTYYQVAATQPSCTDATLHTGSALSYDTTKLNTTGWDVTNYTAYAKAWVAPGGAGGRNYIQATRPIASVNATGGVLNLGIVVNGVYTAQSMNYAICSGDEYIVQGLPQFISAPGEYAYNKTTKDLTIMLPRTLAAADQIRIPTFLGPVVSVSGTSYLTFSGFTLGETYGDGVFVTGASNVTIANNTVTGTFGNGRGSNIGLGNPVPTGVEGDGIGVYASSKVTLKSNIIHDTSNQGVALLSNDARVQALTQSGNAVTDNEIYDIGLSGYGPVMGIAVDDFGVALQRNYIHGMATAAIRGNLMLDDISFNRIEYTGQHVCDLGAIYTGGGAGFLAGRNNTISNNFIKDTGGYCYDATAGAYIYHMPGSTWGIYLDDFATGNKMTNNIIVDAVSCGIQNFGWYNTWKNNLCFVRAGGQAGFTLNGRSGTMPTEYTNAYNAVQTVLANGNGYNGTAYASALPDIKTLPTTWDDSLSQNKLDFENNIVVGNLSTDSTNWHNGTAALSFKSINTSTSTVTNNLYFDTTGAGPLFKGGGMYPYTPAGCVLPQGNPSPPQCLYDYKPWTYSQWSAKNLDTNSGMGAFLDPQFAVAGLATATTHNYTDDFTLKSTSPALTLGFKQIAR